MRKKRIILFLTIAVLVLTPCIYLRYKNQFQITFRYADGRIHKTVETGLSIPIPMPEEPFQKNHIFLGWYTAPVGGEKFDFSQGTTQSLTLYARFRLDASELINDITQNIMKSIVKIECCAYKFTEDYREFSPDGWSQGSGFCFSAGNDYFYILTNCHVARSSPDYDQVDLRIYDYKGNSYRGYVYHDENKKGDAVAAEYDLACIYFISEKSEVTPLPILKKNPPTESDVIALGTPKAQMNAVTFGEITDYRSIALDNTPEYESNVTFPVICHSAEIAGGSSGCPLLNSDLSVVGVCYAKGGTRDGYAIPPEKIQEFLNLYVR